MLRRPRARGVRALGGARRLWLARRLRGAPPALASRPDDERALLLDDELFADDWSPARDTPADGLLLAEPWVLGAADGAPWNGLDVTPRLEQGATLVRAELSAIKAVENDYRTYPAHTGADYEFIRPLADRYRRGTDAAGRPFSTLAIEFRCNLPFPFTHYDCELRILNRWAADGTARTDIYSTSDDFHWLAGRDVFLPVRDSAGARVAWLLVRHFGFDLDGVPDESKHRAEALRSSLGNLRRKAEAFAGAADDAALGDRALTDFAVLGARE
ncbi:MAG: hypothetical protein H6828_07900 [Planctomycetes bacterium]|nr:hypothetical protein [Planctomycetota bacterium]